jgi:truncated hemoglobin YjbI
VSPGQVRPDRVNTESLIAQLLDGVPPERQTGKALAAALADSKLWPREYAFLQSWFEQGEAVAASRRTAGTKKQREEAVLRDILPQRRRRWAELLAWTAKAAEDEVEGEECIDFALVARELSGDRLPSEIPLAVWIAKNTVAA